MVNLYYYTKMTMIKEAERMSTSLSSSNVKQLSKMNCKLLYITSSTYSGNWKSVLHTHHFSELFFVVKGKGEFIVEDRTFPVKENDLVIVNPNVEHTEKAYKDNSLEYVVLGIEGLAFLFDEEKKEVPSFTIHNYGREDIKLPIYLKMMLKEAEEKKLEHEWACQNLLENLLICVVRNQEISITSASAKKISKECGLVKRFIDTNFGDNITLDTLAELAHMNKYYLVHAFTKSIGLSPINYLGEKRIKEGKSLLIHTNYSISQISSFVGFSSQAYFSQAFKKSTGKTPNEYRKEEQAKKEG